MAGSPLTLVAHGVCVVGSINIDTTLTVTSLPQPGETTLSRTRTASFGGKGANQAVAAAWTGAQVAMVGCVGDDSDGVAARQALQTRYINVSAVETINGNSGSAIILVADSAENLIIVNPGANSSLSSAHVRHALRTVKPMVTVAQLEVPLEAVATAADIASRDPEMTFVLNASPVPTDHCALAELLPLVDVLVVNETEVSQLTGIADLSSQPDEVHDVRRLLRFTGHLVVTLGSRGAVVFEAGGDAQHGVTIPARTVTAVDTSGAGDAFCGALAGSLATGAMLTDSAEVATNAAALAVTAPGAMLPARLCR